MTIRKLIEDVYMWDMAQGLLGLSHPRYDLYQRYWNPAERGDVVRGSQHEWHYSMIDMFRELDGQTSILQLAERFRLPFPEVLAYFRKFRDTGAISFVR